MNGFFVDLQHWLADFYLAAGGLLLVSGGVMAAVRQPARRRAIADGTVAALFLAVLLPLVPGWPRLYLQGEAAISPRVRPAPVAQKVESLSAPVEPADGLDAAVGKQPPSGPEPVTPPAARAAHRPPTAAEPLEHSAAEAAGFSADVKTIFALAARCFPVGFLGVGVWLAVGALLTARLRREARTAPPPIQSILARIAAPQPADATVLISDRIGQGLALGVRRPTILLPERFCREESCEALDAVLAHEWAHVRSGDLRRLAALRLLMLVLFAHPLYWWLRARIRLDQELLADAAVARRGDVAEYAEILLTWFRTNDAGRSRLLTSGVGLWQGPHLLKRRIAMLLDETFRVEPAASATYRAAGGLLPVGLVAALSLLTLGAPPSLEAAPDAGVLTAALAPAGAPLPVGSKPAASAAEAPAASPAAKKRAPVDTSKYQNADDAWRTATKHLSLRDHTAAREPLEAALALAPDDKFRLKVYEALKASYRALPEIDPMIETCDFILRHDNDVGRRLTRRDLLSFVFQRGKLNELVELYETALRANPKDGTALFVLAEAYERVPNLRRAAETNEQLLALEADQKKPRDVGASAKLASLYVQQQQYKQGAELFEQIVPLDARLASWHWKEAAAAWLKAKDPTKAAAAARKAIEAGPDTRSSLLTHYWHRHIGEILLATGDAAGALVQFENAKKNTRLDGHIRDCDRLIEEARAKGAGGADPTKPAAEGSGKPAAPAGKGGAGDAQAGAGGAAETKKFWPGMMLMDRSGKASLHIGTDGTAESGVRGLVAALAHTDPGVRESAARWLDSIGPRAAGAVEALKKSLQDPDARVRAAATAALAKITAPASGPAGSR